MTELKKFTRKEISQKNSANEIVFIIHNVVYDVTRFADEHPGGHGVLLDEASTDASDKFVEVGHSADARELMKKYAVGELVDEDKVQLKRQFVPSTSSGINAMVVAMAKPGFRSTWKFPFLMGVLVTLLFSYLLG